MFTDERRATVWQEIGQRDLGAFSKLLSKDIFQQVAERAKVPLGNSALCLPTLVWLGINAARHVGRAFPDLLTITLKILQDSTVWTSTSFAHEKQKARKRKPKERKGKKHKHHPRRNDPTEVTEEAFVQARRRTPLEFWAVLMMVLGEQMTRDHGDHLRWKRFRLLALDGTHIDLGHHGALKKHFGTAKNGLGPLQAQARMVMLQFPLARIPWRYELCPLAQGEPTIAARLLQNLAANDLVLMDQGFFSYGLFCQIHAQKAFFAVRKKEQMKASKIRRLGPRDCIVRWKPADRQWQRAGLPEAMELRVVDYQVKGFRPSAVVTNVLDPAVISRDEWVRMATECPEGTQRLHQGLYHRRWEIETTFCELKVEQGLEGGLRCRTPEGIAYEVAGHVLLYLLVRWLMIEAAEKAGVSPLDLSFKKALGELSDMYASMIVASSAHLHRTLLPRLLDRIGQHRVVFRPGRHYSRPNDTKIRNLGHGRKRIPAKLCKTKR